MSGIYLSVVFPMSVFGSDDEDCKQLHSRQSTARSSKLSWRESRGGFLPWLGRQVSISAKSIFCLSLSALSLQSVVKVFRPEGRIEGCEETMMSELRKMLQAEIQVEGSESKARVPKARFWTNKFPISYDLECPAIEMTYGGRCGGAVFVSKLQPFRDIIYFLCPLTLHGPFNRVRCLRR